MALQYAFTIASCPLPLQELSLSNRHLNETIRVVDNISSAQSENRYNSGIVLRKVGILTLSDEVGILTLRSAIPELLVRKVGIGTK